MIQVQREIEIEAPVQLVWQAITDLKSHSLWSGRKGSITGQVKVGARLRVIARPRRGKAQLSFFKVIRVVENNELRWIATYVPFGLLRGERYWILKKLDYNRTKLVMGEAFMGPMVGLAAKHLERQSTEVFSKLCDGLKQYCEGLAEQ